MGALKRDYLPEGLAEELRGAGLDAAVSVQARQSVEETRWLLEQAARHDFLLGVVGWAPLAAPDVEAALGPLSESPWLRGVRHVVQDEPDDAFLLGADFNRGVACLQKFGLVYDILIYARQTPSAIRFVDLHPEQPFVLDHIAKPTIRAAEFDASWAGDFRELARAKTSSASSPASSPSSAASNGRSARFGPIGTRRWRPSDRGG